MDPVAILLFILPAYFANAVPVVLGGGVPIDLRRNFIDGRRMFGDGKTIQGLFAGMVAAFLVGAIMAHVIPGTQYEFFPNRLAYVISGILLGVGTMAGDLLGSFVKRRMDIEQGSSTVLLDELSFLLVALLFSLLLKPEILTLEAAAFLLVVTYFVHKGANIVANKLGLKKVPW
jgi:CDP-2,3-bis-(O-geranylgeranyl)-sn-glycerol synthase